MPEIENFVFHFPGTFVWPEKSNFGKNRLMHSALQYIRKELQNSFSAAEINEFIKLIFDDLRGYSFTDILLKEEEKLTSAESERICSIVSRIKKSEPVQYILGHVWFCGMKLKVNPSVLIPRPETEELVHWIISSVETPPFRVLDIGTGSGCIALGLKKAFANSLVSGCDVSGEALEVARQNATANRLDVRFFKADILNWENCPDWEKTEMIVSNPPYVTTGDKTFMGTNVLDFEPHLALFVPEDDPLLYYRRITEFSKRWLSENGRLYVEINEQYGEQVAGMLNRSGFSPVEIRKDLQGKDRMVRGIYRKR